MLNTLTRREREVWTACNHLEKEGVPLASITGEAIRECLATLGYKRGGFKEIYRYRESWAKAHNRDLQAPAPPLIQPQALPDPITQAVQQLRRILQTEADEQVAHIKEEAEQSVVLLTNELDVIRQEKAELQESLANKKEECRIFQEEGEKVTQLYRQAEQECIHWKAEATRLGQLAEERLKQQELSINELKMSHQAEIQRFIQQLETSKVDYEKAISEQKEHLEKLRHQWIAEKDQLKTNVHKLEKQLQKIEVAFSSSQDHNKQLLEQVKHVSDTLASFEIKYQELSQVRVQLMSEIERYKNESSSFKQQYAECNDAYQQERQEHLQSMGQIRKLSEMLNNSQALLAKLKLNAVTN